MTLPRLAALAEHWREFPPVHISASAFVERKGKSDARATRADEKRPAWAMLRPVGPDTADWLASMPAQPLKRPFHG